MRYITVVILVCVLLGLGTPAQAEYWLPEDSRHVYEALAILDIQQRETGWEQFVDRSAYSTAYSTPDHTHSHTGVGSGNVERWRPLVAKYFHWEDVDRALCLMGYESGGNPNAKNPTSTATGLMQIMHSVWKDSFGVTHRNEWTDPELNIYAASVIRSTQGWTAWAPYNRGLCR